MRTDGDGLEKQMLRNRQYEAVYLAGEQANFTNEDAQVIGKHLERMAAAGRKITPVFVVADARDIKSPLHKFFEWDDDVAADLYRRQQASGMIRSLRWVVKPMEEGAAAGVKVADHPVKAFFSVETEDGDGQGSRAAREYVTSVEVQTDEVLRRKVSQKALRELRSWSQKYRDLGLEEFAPVYEIVDRLNK